MKIRNRLEILKELLQFFIQQKSFILAPIIIILALMALFAVVAEVPVLTPFIYALF